MLPLYLFGACSYFSFLLVLIVEDKESSLKDPIHLTVALLASIFWFIVIPRSLLELKAKADKKAEVDAFAIVPKSISIADGDI
ncbi:hypothetical protein [Myxosarcina sp. GI1]|uniref:hypothetical protein n=1 Tax=Myxosarcina sp. GI1 TaxID=1541065 RepID=UPI0005647350|nr:hypothetical protein [Myxosarcina sp. GI1]